MSKNCKDCIHFDLCDTCGDYITEFIAQNLTDDEECGFFEEKQPCKVGDKAYAVLLFDDYEIREVTCVGYHKLADSTEYWDMRSPITRNILRYYRSDFGDLIFLTKEEAEKSIEGTLPKTK